VTCPKKPWKRKATAASCENVGAMLRKVLSRKSTSLYSFLSQFLSLSHDNLSIRELGLLVQHFVSRKVEV